MYSPVKCFRCGSCCKNANAMVPATEKSDLSPDFIEHLENNYDCEYVDTYYEEHAIFPGERCKWLVDEADGTTTCSVYEMRGSDCRNYPDPTTGAKYCKVGKLYAEMREG